MPSLTRFLSSLVVVVVPSMALAQTPKKSEEDFVKAKPTIGDALPVVTVYTPDGKAVKTSSLRGQYVVLTFGCLT